MTKQANWLLLLSGALAIFAGFYVMAHPAASLASFALIFAFTLLFNGIAEIINVFRAENRNGWTLFSGILTVIIALSLLGGSFLDLVFLMPYLFGFWALFTAIIRILASFALRKVDSAAANLVLITGILGLVISLLMMSSPLFMAEFVVYLVAFVLIFQGISSIVFYFKAKKAA